MDTLQGILCRIWLIVKAAFVPWCRVNISIDGPIKDERIPSTFGLHKRKVRGVKRRLAPFYLWVVWLKQRDKYEK